MKSIPFRSVAVVLFVVASARSVSAQEVRWRTNYNAARLESREKNQPLFLDFGTTHCFWCRKLDATTFRDPDIVRILNEHFVPTKVEAEQEPSLVQTLGITGFPTLVVAAPDGKILLVQPGYLDAADLHGKLRAVLGTARDAKTLASTGTHPTSTKESVRTTVYPCLPDDANSGRAKASRELLDLAKEERMKGRFASCLDRCKVLTTDYSDLPEAREASRLSADIKANPVTAGQACDELAQHLAELSLEAAESCFRNGQLKQAMAHLERVMVTCPDSRFARTAEQRLAQLSQPQENQDPKRKIRAQAP